MAPKPRFTDGEKVLCFHGPLLYEAKCLKSQIRDKNIHQYFIHYSGWNKNWDEWVSECRVLKYNETNLQKQKELEKTHKKTKKSKSASKASVKKENEKEPVPTTSSEKPIKPKTEKKVSVPSSSAERSAENQPEPKQKKVRFELEPCFLEEAEVEVEIKLNIPEPLKSWLLDDWDLITRQQKILSLPARVTVDHVIANYVKEKVSVKGISQLMENTTVQVANRIRDCFNVLLGKMLLFKFERPQYAETLVEYPECDMCQIYGAIHLLRMFTKLGALLTPIVGTENPSSLVGHLNDFAMYMSMNRNFFHLDDYVVASPEYHRRAL